MICISSARCPKSADNTEGDEYVFDNVEVTKDIWEKLTERFLYIDEDGIERIKNEIEWTDLTV